MSFDSNRFIELLRPEYNDALAYCRALCSGRSAEDANDVIQQSLLKALERFSTLRNEDSFRSWLFSIITREFYSFVRRDFWKRFTPMDDDTIIRNMPELIDNSNEEYFSNDISSALNCLSRKERAAILLFEIGDFSIEEIKNIQNELTTSAVKSRLSRARAKLRDFFKNENSKPAKELSTQISEGGITDETYRLIQQARSAE